MASDDEHPFMCPWTLCMSSLKKCLFRSFAHLFTGLFDFLMWSHVSYLCILDIKPLSKVSFENIFSHTVGSLFILLMFSLATQKLFILMRSHLFILSFMSLALGVCQWKYRRVECLRFSCLCSPLGLLWCCNLYLCLLSILSLFLYMV